MGRGSSRRLCAVRLSATLCESAANELGLRTPVFRRYVEPGAAPSQPLCRTGCDPRFRLDRAEASVQLFTFRPRSPGVEEPEPAHRGEPPARRVVRERQQTEAGDRALLARQVRVEQTD